MDQKDESAPDDVWGRIREALEDGALVTWRTERKKEEFPRIYNPSEVKPDE